MLLSVWPMRVARSTTIRGSPDANSFSKRQREMSDTALMTALSGNAEVVSAFIGGKGTGSYSNPRPSSVERSSIGILTAFIRFYAAYIRIFAALIFIQQSLMFMCAAYTFVSTAYIFILPYFIFM